MFVGKSIAGINTTLAVPSLDCVFDCGIPIPELWKLNNLLITHTHSDHMASLLWRVHMRNCMNLTPGNIFCHPDEVKSLSILLDCFNDIVDKGYGRFPYSITALEPDIIYRINKTLSVKPFLTDHTTLCQGYIVGETRNKLKEQYIDYSQEEIIRLSKAGEILSEPVFFMKAAYTGDTRISVFESNPELLIVPHLAMEVTSFADVERMETWGHCSMLQLLELPFENESITIVHTSNRYTMEECSIEAYKFRERFPRIRFELIRE